MAPAGRASTVDPFSRRRRLTALKSDKKSTSSRTRPPSVTPRLCPGLSGPAWDPSREGGSGGRGLYWFSAPGHHAGPTVSVTARHGFVPLRKRGRAPLFLRGVAIPAGRRLDFGRQGRDQIDRPLQPTVVNN